MKRFLLALFFVLCSLNEPAFAQAIPVQNGSFETYGPLTEGSYNVGPIPSWVCAGVGPCGSWQPAASAFSSLPDGKTIAFSNGGTVSQDLGVTVQGGSYTATVQNGTRLDGYSGQSVSNISLLVGGTVLCTQSIKNGAQTWGEWQPLSCSYQTPITIPTGNLIVQLGCAVGWQCDWKDVSVSFTPANVIPPINLTVTGSLLFDDKTPFAFGATINVQQCNGSSWVNVGTVTSDSSGNITGTLSVNPNWVVPTSLMSFQFSVAGIGGSVSQTVPLAELQQGSTGVNLAVVLFKSSMLPKSFSIGLTP